jgi:DNA-binding MarR family transcriptional regulator
MIDRMSDTSRIVGRLIKKGLVDKAMHPTDKRKVAINITEKGLQLLSRIDPRQEELDNLVSSVSPHQGETLNYLLDKLRGWDDDNTVF